MFFPVRHPVMAPADPKDAGGSFGSSSRLPMQETVTHDVIKPFEPSKGDAFRNESSEKADFEFEKFINEKPILPTDIIMPNSTMLNKRWLAAASSVETKEDLLRDWKSFEGEGSQISEKSSEKWAMSSVSSDISEVHSKNDRAELPATLIIPKSQELENSWLATARQQAADLKKKKEDIAKEQQALENGINKIIDPETKMFLQIKSNPVSAEILSKESAGINYNIENNSTEINRIISIIDNLEIELNNEKLIEFDKSFEKQTHEIYDLLLASFHPNSDAAIKNKNSPELQSLLQKLRIVTVGALEKYKKRLDEGSITEMFVQKHNLRSQEYLGLLLDTVPSLNKEISGLLAEVHQHALNFAFLVPKTEEWNDAARKAIDWSAIHTVLSEEKTNVRNYTDIQWASVLARSKWEQPDPALFAPIKNNFPEKSQFYSENVGKIAYNATSLLKDHFQDSASEKDFYHIFAGFLDENLPVSAAMLKRKLQVKSRL